MVYIVFLKKNHVHTCIVMSSNYSCNMRFIEVITWIRLWSIYCWPGNTIGPIDAEVRDPLHKTYDVNGMFEKKGGGTQYCSMKLTFKVVGKQNKSGFSICVLLRSWDIQNVDLFARQSLFRLNLFPMFDVFAYLMCSPQHTTPFDLLPIEGAG